METAIAAAAIGMLLLGAVILGIRRWRAGAAEKVSFAAAGPVLNAKERLADSELAVRFMAKTGSRRKHPAGRPTGQMESLPR